jgi:hypothetical protein
MLVFTDEEQAPYCSDQLFLEIIHLQRDRHLRWLIY